MKVIFHLDLDSYFVSAERSINNKLKNKPVAISSGERRSIISAASYEAKKAGIYVPMPFYKAKDLCPELIVIKPNYVLYTTLSNNMFELISNNFTKNIEVGSIDECYMDVTDIWGEYGSPIKLAKIIQKKLLEKLDLPCSIGISHNKFLAKMSTCINKPLGITVTKPGDHKKFWNWELRRYFGIGPQTERKLNAVGITTIGDLAIADINILRAVLGVKSKQFKDQANGIGTSRLNFEHNELSGLSNSITFQSMDFSSRKDILEQLSILVAKLSHRATLRNVLGWVVSVSIKKKGGKDIKELKKQETLNRPIKSYDDILKEAIRIFDYIWDESPLKFISVHLDKLENMFDISYQASIYDEERDGNKIEKIINDVNHKMRYKSIMSGKEFGLSEFKMQNQLRYLESDRIIKHYDKNIKK